MNRISQFFSRNVSKEFLKSGLPSRRYHHADTRFKNGSAQDMNVNGSIVPQEFIAGPSAGVIWIVDYITLVLIDAGDMLPTNFGSLPGLANGLEFFSNMDSVERLGTSLDDNLDILQCFAGARPGAVGPAGSGDAGFLNTVDYVSGRLSFEGGEFVLFGDKGDHLGFRVNDDLLLSDEIRASIHVRVLL